MADGHRFSTPMRKPTSMLCNLQTRAASAHVLHAAELHLPAQESHEILSIAGPSIHRYTNKSPSITARSRDAFYPRVGVTSSSEVETVPFIRVRRRAASPAATSESAHHPTASFPSSAGRCPGYYSLAVYRVTDSWPPRGFFGEGNLPLALRSTTTHSLTQDNAIVI